MRTIFREFLLHQFFEILEFLAYKNVENMSSKYHVGKIMIFKKTPELFSVDTSVNTIMTLVLCRMVSTLVTTLDTLTTTYVPIS